MIDKSSGFLLEILQKKLNVSNSVILFLINS